ncbi:hypothetical protein ACN38_g2681 [Penicillium nordicum]|uniref:Uncharacterized protein n=2 Tax=Penicillium TaxID=5073 RepID=A0A0N0RZK8_9EURO|nr:hypothetical protein ACN38_g2681 [Penicillium nordicum]
MIAKALGNRKVLLHPKLLEYCHVMHYIYRSLDNLSVMLRYNGLSAYFFNSPVQGQVVASIFSSHVISRIPASNTIYYTEGLLPYSYRPYNRDRIYPRNR